MGEVYAAENTRTSRPVALKVLRDDSKQKAVSVERFRREARAAGSINSDHVTQVLDVEDDPEHGIVLVFELLEGESLIERLKRTGPMEFHELFGLVEQLWLGLAAAHRVGIVHRDLKPSNVFLERREQGQNRVKILDFGISKLPKDLGQDTLTELGQSLGTYSFMPPEQIGHAKTVDHRADIYAAATLIYQAMSGQLPYAATNVLVLAELKKKQEPRTLAAALSRPVDRGLESFLARALARDPDARFGTALDALAAWRELEPTRLISANQLHVRDALSTTATADGAIASSVQAATPSADRPSASRQPPPEQSRERPSRPSNAPPPTERPGSRRDAMRESEPTKRSIPSVVSEPSSTSEVSLSQTRVLGARTASTKATHSARAKLKRGIGLILAAAALVVIGFVLAALALNYTRSGTFIAR